MRITKKVRLGLICLLLILLSAGCSAADADSSIAAHGQIEVGTGSIARLSGEWGFYWQKFIRYDELETFSPDAFIGVPSRWNGTLIEGKPISGMGFATYTLHVKTPFPKGQQLGLNIRTFSSAYRLYVNDLLIAGNGRPSDNANEEVAEYRPQTVYFTAPDSEFDIIVHVSNHVYARGGFWDSMTIGKAGAISDRHDSALSTDAFLTGMFFFTFLFCLVLFLLRRELVHLLYFAFLCMALLFESDFMGQMNLFHIFPYLNFTTMIFLWYSVGLWVFLFLFLFVHRLYKSKLSTVLLHIFAAVVIVQQLFYLFTPVSFYSQYLGDMSILSSIIMVVGSVWVVILGIRRKVFGGWLHLISIVIAMLAFLHDNLYFTEIIRVSRTELLKYGLQIFLMLQLIYQAYSIKNDYEEKRNAQLAFLHAQIKPHFIFNVLNTVISVSYDDTDKARALLTQTAGYLRQGFDIKDTSQMVTLRSEIELCKSYAMLEKARFEERLTVDFDVSDELNLMVPMLILQPIIENAIHHGLLPKAQGGTVTVHIALEGKYVVFSVCDNGVGMDKETVEAILSGGSQSGVGIGNIHSRLKKLYGKGLTITSGIGEGTKVTWTIPHHRKVLHQR